MKSKSDEAMVSIKCCLSTIIWVKYSKQDLAAVKEIDEDSDGIEYIDGTGDQVSNLITL